MPAAITAALRNKPSTSSQVIRHAANAARQVLQLKLIFGYGDLEIVEACDEVLEADAGLGAGKVRAQAVVRSVAETQVTVRCARDVERQRRLKLPRVMIGRAEQRHDRLSSGDRDAVEFDVFGRPVWFSALYRPAMSQNLLYRGVDQGRVGP